MKTCIQKADNKDATICVDEMKPKLQMDAPSTDISHEVLSPSTTHSYTPASLGRVAFTVRMQRFSRRDTSNLPGVY